MPNQPGGWISGTTDIYGHTSPDVATGTYKIYAEVTEKSQIYTRKMTATQPSDITLSINKSIKGIDKYSENFFDLPEYNLSGTKFYLYDSAKNGSRIKNTAGNDAVFTISGSKGGKSNSVEISAAYANDTVYLEEVLPSTATGFKQPTGRLR